MSGPVLNSKLTTFQGVSVLGSGGPCCVYTAIFKFRLHQVVMEITRHGSILCSMEEF